MRKLLSTLLFLVLLISISIVIYAYAEGDYSIENTILEVYEDGSVQVTYIIKVDNPPVNITVDLLGNPLYVECLASETPIPVDVNGLKASFLAPDTDINLTYVTSELTSKSGEEWMLKYSLNRPSMVILPEDAFVYDISPENFDVTIIDSKVAIGLPAGSVSIRYVIYPNVQPTPTPPQPGIGGINLGSLGTILLIGIPIVIVIVLVVYLLKMRGSSSISSVMESLDERDKTILNLLKDYGELTAKDIMNISGIPKTPLYRRLNRLREAKLIEAVKKGGIVYYRLRK